MLFYDPTGSGQLTQANQVIFTDWDPSAKSDMQALLDVFDTNHDGALNAGDVNFSKFYVMVTNADGTQTAQSLASLGIASINLVEDATRIVLPDGSSIDGQTSYTMSGGASGTVATVTLATDAHGYVVTTASSTNGDGSVTIGTTESNTDGSLDHQRILDTQLGSATSSGVTTTTTNKVLSTVNNGGVVLTLQTDNIAASSNGTTTEVLTNYSAGTITSTGALTSAGTTGSEKLNSTTTTTAVTSGGKVVTIQRDTLGGGWTTQQEVDTTPNSGAASYVVSNLNPDGTANYVTSSTVASGGLVRTSIGLIDGNSALATTSVDATVINPDGTRTETVTTSSGTTVTSLVQTVTSTTSNSVSRTTSSYLTDGATLNRVSLAQTVTTSGGSVTTQTDRSADGTLLDQIVTSQTPQASGGLATAVVTSALDNGVFIGTGSQVTSISNAGGTATTTVTDYSANGTLQSQSITAATLGSADRTVTIYGNGDGRISQYETVTVSSGTTTDTLQLLNGDGSLRGATVTSTASGGLSRTIQIDATGAGTAAAPVFDHITTDVTTSSAGTSTETVTHYGATTANKIDQAQTVVTSGGLETIVSDAFTSSSLASGTWDQVTTDLTTISAGGALSETVTVTDGASHLLTTVQKNTSADRRTVTTTKTLGSTNLVKQVETATIANNGTAQDQVVNFDQLGDVLGATVTTTTADGLVKTVKRDIQGQSAAVFSSSGLAFDIQTTDTTVVNADGSRAETVNATSQNGTLLSTATTSTSANGLSVNTTYNPYATAHYATKATRTTALNADGSTTVADADYSYNQTLIDATRTVAAAGGLGATVTQDLNGDGITDLSTTDFVTINADGSRTETVTDYTGGTNGTVRDVVTTHNGIIVAGAGLESVTTRQSFGSVPLYQVETVMPSANGSVSDTTDYYASLGGALLRRTVATTSANGLTTTVATDVNGDTAVDFSTTDAVALNADGSRTETVSTSNQAGLLAETVTIISGNGLSKTTKVDANGAVNGLGEAIFNRVTTDNIVLNRADGSRAETVTNFNASGNATTQSVTTVSADQQTTTVNRYLNQTGVITTVDQTETIQTQANGSVVDTTTSYNTANALLGTITRTFSGNGLSVQTVYRNAAGTVVDTQSTTTTYNLNGDGGYLVDAEDADVVNGSTTLQSSVRTQVSGNGKTRTTTMALTGALASQLAASTSVTTQDVIAIDDFGTRTETTAVTVGNATIPTDTTTVITSADGLTTTSSTAFGNAAPGIVETKTTNLDGSKTDTTIYYSKLDPTFIVAESVVDTSFDGRTVSAVTYSDFDGVQYNVVTDTVVENADNTTTETRSGSGSFGAMAFSQIVANTTNADASRTTTTLNYDPTNLLIGQTVADISGNGLAKSFVYDTTGLDVRSNLEAAASAILTGASLPTSLLMTDIIGSDVTTLNVDGSRTETIKTAYGNSFANLRSQSTTSTSANGLSTVTRIDNNGNGVFDQVETTTIAPDGSKTVVYAYYGDTAATANTLQGRNTYTVSANGLVTTLTTSTGVTDTTATFANANGSYQWSRVVSPNSPEVTNASTPHNASASHIVDANGIDTWTLSDGYGQKQTITIDLATEKRNIAIANEISQTLLGRPLDNADTQGLLNFIDSNGVLDRFGFAYATLQTSDYLYNYAIPGSSPGTYYYYGFDVSAAFQNAFGRLPTAEEMATFGQYIHDSAPNAFELANLVVAVAQYATDQGAKNNRISVDPNQDLVSTAPQWINPAASIVALTTAGTYSYSNQWLEDGNRAAGTGGVALTINGNNDAILALDGSNLTLNGYNNSVDIAGVTATVNTSNAAITIEDSGIGSVSGNNNQIAQVGSTELILNSGTGNQIYVGAGDLLSGFAYTLAYPVTQASNATITIGPSVGTFDNSAEVFGDNDLIYVDNGAYVSVIGNNNTIDVIGTGTVFVYGTVTGSQASYGGLIEVTSGSTATNTTVSSGSVLALFGGASASGTTVLSGGTLEIGAGYTQTGFTVGNGAFLQVDSGGTATGTVVGSGGTLVLFGGATATGTSFASGSFEEIVGGYSLGNYTTSNGVTLEVASGAVVTSAAVTAGNAMEVFAGGVVSAVTVSSGGNFTNYGAVYGANVAAGASVTVGYGGLLDVMAGQTARGVIVQDGGALVVGSGGNASGTVVSSGGILELLGGATATGTVLATGAILDIGSGLTQTNYVVSSGMILAVEAGGTVSGTIVQSGGTLELVGGNWSNTTVNAGGTLYVGTGATLSNYVVSSGVTVEVVAGASVSNLTVNSGGQLLIYGGTVNGVLTSGGSVIVNGGGSAAATSGQTVSGLTVSSGGTLTVSAGATARNITVASGGQLINYGTTSGAVVSSGGSATVSGGTLNVLSGQTAWNVSVASAANLVVSSGSIVNNATVASGGHLVVNGTVVGATVSNGGAVISSGGVLDLSGQTASGVTVNNGGALIVDFSASASNVTVSSGGSLSVVGYNSNVEGATIASGATAVVSGFAQLGVRSGQSVNGVTVAADGLLYVTSGGRASGTVVSSGGTLEVFSGGVASATTILNGGTYEVGSGFKLSGYVVSSGTILEVASGGTVSGTTVSSGGTLELLRGATASSTTYSSGSFLEIASGYTMSNYVTSANVTLEVAAGATVSGATINSGTALKVFYGGLLNSATVNSGGNLVIDGTVNGATVAAGGNVIVDAWGKLNVSSGQTIRGTTVTNGGTLVLSAGSVASGTVISNGGQVILNGTASGSTVNAGGVELVNSGGVVTSAVINGGTLEVVGGGAASAVSFSGGGTLKLDSSVTFGGVISGFALLDHIDLADINFSSSTTFGFVEAGNNQSGTLTVSDGVHTAHLTLAGQYTTSRFTMVSDGQGGTLIGDPPASDAAAATTTNEHDNPTGEIQNSFTDLRRLLGFADDWNNSIRVGDHWRHSNAPPELRPGISAWSAETEAQLSRLVGAISMFSGTHSGFIAAALAQEAAHDQRNPAQLAASWHG